jgi:hypothetical protein
MVYGLRLRSQFSVWSKGYGQEILKTHNVTFQRNGHRYLNLLTEDIHFRNFRGEIYGVRKES